MTASVNPDVALPWQTRAKQCIVGAWLINTTMVMGFDHLPLPMPVTASVAGAILGTTDVGTVWPAWRNWVAGE